VFPREDDVNDGGLCYWQTVGQWEQQTGMAASMHINKDSNMANIKDLSKSKYLKTQDVPEPVIVTFVDIDIANVAKEGERKDERLVVKFKEFEKHMVFNATNMKRTAKFLGSDETDDWIGKKVVLYTDEDVEYAGEIVGGLRVRAVKKRQPDPEDEPDPRYKDEKPKQRLPGNMQEMDDEIPF
jgi:hypothetical protein